MYIWSTSAPLRTSECMLGATNACTAGRSGVPLSGWKGTKRTANGPAATGTREGPIGRSRVSTSCWLHWASLWPQNTGITCTGPPLTWRRASCLSPRAPSQAGMYPCLSPWRVMSQVMRALTTSSPTAVLRDWWMTWCLAYGTCQTLHIA